MPPTHARSPPSSVARSAKNSFQNDASSAARGDGSRLHFETSSK
jgi:hypothetical protein